VLGTPNDVIRCLVTYTDWWQPVTTSVLQIAASGRKRDAPDGLRPGLVEHLEERTELCRRMEQLKARERLLLYLWYVKEAEIPQIARRVGVSQRHVFRVRAAAVKKIVDLGEDEHAA
jgi:DNA-directed RNA polymerase specialized sigma subunit